MKMNIVFKVQTRTIGGRVDSDLIQIQSVTIHSATVSESCLKNKFKNLATESILVLNSKWHPPFLPPSSQLIAARSAFWQSVGKVKRDIQRSRAIILNNWPASGGHVHHDIKIAVGLHVWIHRRFLGQSNGQ